MRILLIALVLLAVPAHASHTRTLTIDGRTRTFHVYRPAARGPARPLALVVVLHGGFGSGAQAEHAYHWDEEADRDGFVIAYPDGFRRSWNAGGICCGPANSDKVDDLAFLTALIGDLEKTEGIDAKRVYLAGMSNGAAMAYWYACNGPLPIAAVGSVSGSLAAPCGKAHAVSVMEIHGTDDANIPLAGGHGRKAATKVQWLAVARTLDIFRKADHCAPAVSHVSAAVTTTASLCEGGRQVSLITIAGAGHQWPGSLRPRLLGRLMGLDPPSSALDATRTLGQFFAAHPLD
ncbi:MAG: polyhydroxybutyrate depolymerase [Alphaproteobacteria bacterium]|nr:polyhydroxybutyrate depolymerase [Alphaproteobacteria bacterium]